MTCPGKIFALLCEYSVLVAAAVQVTEKARADESGRDPAVNDG